MNVKLEAILIKFMDVEESRSSIGTVRGVVQSFPKLIYKYYESVPRFEVRMSLPRYYRMCENNVYPR